MEKSNRRQFMRAAAGLGSVAAVGSTAGCLDSVPLVGESSTMDAVPEDADAVVYADLDTIREDEGVRTLTNTYFEQQAEYEYYEGPEDFASAMGLSEMAAGTSVSARIDSDDEISVIYTSPSGDSSAILATYEAPGA